MEEGGRGEAGRHGTRRHRRRPNGGGVDGARRRERDGTMRDGQDVDCVGNDRQRRLTPQSIHEGVDLQGGVQLMLVTIVFTIKKLVCFL